LPRQMLSRPDEKNKQTGVYILPLRTGAQHVRSKWIQVGSLHQSMLEYLVVKLHREHDYINLRHLRANSSVDNTRMHRT